MDEGAVYGSRRLDLGRLSGVGFGSQLDGNTHWTLEWRGQVSCQEILGHSESHSCPQAGLQKSGHAEEVICPRFQRASGQGWGVEGAVPSTSGPSTLKG